MRVLFVYQCNKERGGFPRTFLFDKERKVVYLLPDCMAESHFWGQYRLVYDKKDGCLVDFVGKIEDIKETYRPIQERFNFLPLPHTH